MKPTGKNPGLLLVKGFNRESYLKDGVDSGPNQE